MRPPICRSASTRTTSAPASRSTAAAARPDNPAPMITTSKFLPLDLHGVPHQAPRNSITGLSRWRRILKTVPLPRWISVSQFAPQQRLYFRPEPQGQGSFLPTLLLRAGADDENNAASAGEEALCGTPFVHLFSAMTISVIRSA